MVCREEGSDVDSSEEEGESKAPQTGLLSDPRFGALFTNKDFEIDKTNEDYLLKHPEARPSAEAAKAAARRYVAATFDANDDVDEDDSDASMSDDDGERGKGARVRMYSTKTSMKTNARKLQQIASGSSARATAEAMKEVRIKNRSLQSRLKKMRKGKVCLGIFGFVSALLLRCALIFLGGFHQQFAELLTFLAVRATRIQTDLTMMTMVSALGGKRNSEAVAPATLSSPWGSRVAEVEGAAVAAAVAAAVVVVVVVVVEAAAIAAVAAAVAAAEEKVAGADVGAGECIHTYILYKYHWLQACTKLHNA